MVNLLASGYATAGQLDDDKAALHSHFDPSNRYGVEISSRTVGKRLMSMISAPFYVGDHVMELKDIRTNSDKEAKRTATFKVAVNPRG